MAMRANSENTAHSPDLGRCCIMRPMLDCNCGHNATICGHTSQRPSARVAGIVTGELQPMVVKLVWSCVLDAVAWIAGAGRDFLRWVEGGFPLTGDRRL
ncbi:hypothetical protein N7508_006476 [Penicillium antarcticum]|uniref:uncharacterized protein n=1 Tax=Penicillium antarcticum TaxID=416450 RepID=UPI0023A527FB|nr:uncharacterized protein N7508_006476 [Penicillium antarcticum]KAJ5301613.1 hypothetical protein N7508_006476 [Penicillium antarcticum]